MKYWGQLQRKKVIFVVLTFGHLLKNIENDGALHRAFSVFLFNSEDKLLLQQRSSFKITFPLYWTNTCCSHPLFSIEEERNGVEGVKKAAIRKLNHELGITSLSTDDIYFITRILYKAPSCSVWGEHEVDYVLFVKKDVDLNLNLNEVGDFRYATKNEVKSLLHGKLCKV